MSFSYSSSMVCEKLTEVSEEGNFRFDSLLFLSIKEFENQRHQSQSGIPNVIVK